MKDIRADRKARDVPAVRIPGGYVLGLNQGESVGASPESRKCK
jgi:hypothetical protein